jgi:ABC-type transport system involved in multi-copper enzyme maturation permease subunit
MTLVHLAGVIRAETSKLLSRRMARIGGVVSVLIGVCVPLLYAMFWSWRAEAQFSFNGQVQGVGDYADASAVVAYALLLRNFFVLRAFVVVLGALSMAGELSASTLREDLLRPVPRVGVWAGKAAALAIFIAGSLFLTGAFSSVIGLALYGFTGDWMAVGLAYFGTLATDVVFSWLVLAVAVCVRSVAMTVAGILVFFVFDLVAWASLYLAQFAIEAAQMAQPEMELPLPALMEFAIQARNWLPSAAFGVWYGAFGEMEWIAESLVALVLIGAACVTVGVTVFQSRDIP